MTIIGIDCNITLTHADINSGNPFGFLLVAEKPEYGPHVSIQRTVDADGVTTIRCYFTIIAADNIINPNGKHHAETRSQMYAKIIEYLAKVDGVLLNTVNGMYTNLGASGHSATEMHYSNQSIIACMFNNAGVYFPPVDPEILNHSVWDGTLTWSTSYWR